MNKRNLVPDIHFASKPVAIILFLLFSFNLSAQGFELIKIESAYYPNESIEGSSVDGKIGFVEWGGQLAIPQTFKNNKKTVLIHKLGYANLRVDTKGNPNGTSLETEKHYHTVSYNLRFVQPLNPNWLMMVNLNPTLASDFEESLNEDDLLYQASALAINSKNEKIKYGFGVAFTARFGRQLVIPIGMFKYSTSKINLDILLPSEFSIMFNTPNKKFHYGLEAGLNGGLFNNTSEVQTISNEIDEAGYSRLNIGPAITLRLKNAININLHGGMAVGRRLEFIDTEEDAIDRTPEPGPFFRMGLSFSPNKKSKKIND